MYSQALDELHGAYLSNFPDDSPILPQASWHLHLRRAAANFPKLHQVLRVQKLLKDDYNSTANPKFQAEHDTNIEELAKQHEHIRNAIVEAGGLLLESALARGGIDSTVNKFIQHLYNKFNLNPMINCEVAARELEINGEGPQFDYQRDLAAARGNHDASQPLKQVDVRYLAALQGAFTDLLADHDKEFTYLKDYRAEEGGQPVASRLKVLTYEMDRLRVCIHWTERQLNSYLQGIENIEERQRIANDTGRELLAAVQDKEFDREGFVEQGIEDVSQHLLFGRRLLIAYDKAVSASDSSRLGARFTPIIPQTSPLNELKRVAGELGFCEELLCSIADDKKLLDPQDPRDTMKIRAAELQIGRLDNLIEEKKRELEELKTALSSSKEIEEIVAAFSNPETSLAVTAFHPLAASTTCSPSNTSAGSTAASAFVPTSAISTFLNNEIAAAKQSGHSFQQTMALSGVLPKAVKQCHLIDLVNRDIGLHQGEVLYLTQTIIPQYEKICCIKSDIQAEQEGKEQELAAYKQKRNECFERLENGIFEREIADYQAQLAALLQSDHLSKIILDVYTNPNMRQRGIFEAQATRLVNGQKYGLAAEAGGIPENEIRQNLDKLLAESLPQSESKSLVKLNWYVEAEKRYEFFEFESRPVPDGKVLGPVYGQAELALIKDNLIKHENLFNLIPGADFNPPQSSAPNLSYAELQKSLKALAELRAQVAALAQTPSPVILDLAQIERSDNKLKEFAAIQITTQNLSPELSKALAGYDLEALNSRIASLKSVLADKKKLDELSPELQNVLSEIDLDTLLCPQTEAPKEEKRTSSVSPSAPSLAAPAKNISVEALYFILFGVEIKPKEILYCNFHTPHLYELYLQLSAANKQWTAARELLNNEEMLRGSSKPVKLEIKKLALSLERIDKLPDISLKYLTLAQLRASISKLASESVAEYVKGNPTQFSFDSLSKQLGTDLGAAFPEITLTEFAFSSLDARHEGFRDLAGERGRLNRQVKDFRERAVAVVRSVPQYYTFECEAFDPMASKHYATEVLDIYLCALGSEDPQNRFEELRSLYLASVKHPQDKQKQSDQLDELAKRLDVPKHSDLSVFAEGYSKLCDVRAATAACEQLFFEDRALLANRVAEFTDPVRAQEMQGGFEDRRAYFSDRWEKLQKERKKGPADYTVDKLRMARTGAGHMLQGFAFVGDGLFFPLLYPLTWPEKMGERAYYFHLMRLNCGDGESMYGSTAQFAQMTDWGIRVSTHPFTHFGTFIETPFDLLTLAAEYGYAADMGMSYFDAKNRARVDPYAKRHYDNYIIAAETAQIIISLSLLWKSAAAGLSRTGGELTSAKLAAARTATVLSSLKYSTAFGAGITFGTEFSKDNPDFLDREVLGLFLRNTKFSVAISGATGLLKMQSQARALAIMNGSRAPLFSLERAEDLFRFVLRRGPRAALSLEEKTARGAAVMGKTAVRLKCYEIGDASADLLEISRERDTIFKDGFHWNEWKSYRKLIGFASLLAGAGADFKDNVSIGSAFTSNEALRASISQRSGIDDATLRREIYSIQGQLQDNLSRTAHFFDSLLPAPASQFIGSVKRTLPNRLGALLPAPISPGTGFWADNARALSSIIGAESTGVFHVENAGLCSQKFMCRLARQLEKDASFDDNFLSFSDYQSGIRIISSSTLSVSALEQEVIASSYNVYDAIMGSEGNQQLALQRQAELLAPHGLTLDLSSLNPRIVRYDAAHPLVQPAQIAEHALRVDQKMQSELEERLAKAIENGTYQQSVSHVEAICTAYFKQLGVSYRLENGLFYIDPTSVGTSDISRRAKHLSDKERKEYVLSPENILRRFVGAAARPLLANQVELTEHQLFYDATTALNSQTFLSLLLGSTPNGGTPATYLLSSCCTKDNSSFFPWQIAARLGQVTQRANDSLQFLSQVHTEQQLEENVAGLEKEISEIRSFGLQSLQSVVAEVQSDSTKDVKFDKIPISDTESELIATFTTKEGSIKFVLCRGDLRGVYTGRNFASTKLRSKYTEIALDKLNELSIMLTKTDAQLIKLQGALDAFKLTKGQNLEGRRGSLASALTSVEGVSLQTTSAHVLAGVCSLCGLSFLSAFVRGRVAEDERDDEEALLALPPPSLPKDSLRPLNSERLTIQLKVPANQGLLAEVPQIRAEGAAQFTDVEQAHLLAVSHLPRSARAYLAYVQEQGLQSNALKDAIAAYSASQDPVGTASTLGDYGLSEEQRWQILGICMEKDFAAFLSDDLFPKFALSNPEYLLLISYTVRAEDPQYLFGIDPVQDLIEQTKTMPEIDRARLLMSITPYDKSFLSDAFAKLGIKEQQVIDMLHAEGNTESSLPPAVKELNDLQKARTVIDQVRILRALFPDDIAFIKRGIAQLGISDRVTADQLLIDSAFSGTVRLRRGAPSPLVARLPDEEKAAVLRAMIPEQITLVLKSLRHVQIGDQVQLYSLLRECLAANPELAVRVIDKLSSGYEWRGESQSYLETVGLKDPSLLLDMLATLIDTSKVVNPQGNPTCFCPNLHNFPPPTRYALTELCIRRKLLASARDLEEWGIRAPRKDSSSLFTEAQRESLLQEFVLAQDLSAPYALMRLLSSLNVSDSKERSIIISAAMQKQPQLVFHLDKIPIAEPKVIVEALRAVLTTVSQSSVAPASRQRWVESLLSLINKYPSIAREIVYHCAEADLATVMTSSALLKPHLDHKTVIEIVRSLLQNRGGLTADEIYSGLISQLELAENDPDVQSIVFLSLAFDARRTLSSENAAARSKVSDVATKLCTHEKLLEQLIDWNLSRGDLENAFYLLATFRRAKGEQEILAFLDQRAKALLAAPTSSEEQKEFLQFYCQCRAQGATTPQQFSAPNRSEESNENFVRGMITGFQEGS